MATRLPSATLFTSNMEDRIGDNLTQSIPVSLLAESSSWWVPFIPALNKSAVVVLIYAQLCSSCATCTECREIVKEITKLCLRKLFTRTKEE